MTGEQLHAAYVEAMSCQGIVCDDWDALPEDEQAAWNDLASRVTG